MSTTTDLDPYPHDVYLGFWTNWSHGKILGATLTLSHKNGGFLISFLAVFVGMVGTSFWRVCCFTLHQALSSATPQDGLYHQRQAILRNSDAAEDGAWRFVWLMLAWKRRARRPLLRLLPAFLLATLIWTCFSIASIFSSHVTTDTANEVLLSGKKCGRLDPGQSSTDYLTILEPFFSQRGSAFLSYALNCYTDSRRRADGCNLYPKSQLPLSVSNNASCPFDEAICQTTSQNLLLDTGLLDSHYHLGVNSPPEERFQIRLVHHCAPLVTQNFTEVANDSMAEPVIRYLYGSSDRNTSSSKGTRWTYEVPLNDAPLPSDGTNHQSWVRQEYSLRSKTAHANNTGWNVDFVPIKQLQRPDTDTILTFLSARGIRFENPVDDPVFAAHRKAPTIVSQLTHTFQPAYLQDEPTGVLACTRQVQYCKANVKGAAACEPLRGLLVDMSDTLHAFWPSQHQQNLVKAFDTLLTGDSYSIDDIIACSGAAALKARYGLANDIQGPLPPNQWQIEAEYWVKGTLASIQDSFIAFATGPPNGQLQEFLVRAATNDSGAQHLCHNQKIVSTAYSSFNVFGIAMILILGGIIMLLEKTLEPATRWFQERRYRKLLQQAPHPQSSKHPLYSSLEWSVTSTLQLQRLAHQELGYGTWSQAASGHPITLPGEELAVLDIDNVKHPVLARAPASSSVGGEEDDLKRSDTQTNEWHDVKLD